MNTLIINKNDLRHNIDIIKKQVDNENYTIIGVVKGNGYGLGLEDYSKILIENGIKILATATTQEAAILRKLNENIDILNMSSTADEKELQELADNNIIITIGSLETARAVNKIANNGQKVRAHIKIDTGFGRYGFLYNDKENIIKTIKNFNNNIKVEGIFTHFSLAYYKDNASTKNQFNAFMDVIKSLENENIDIKLRHACNSPAFVNYPEMRLNCARIGSAFLGRIDAQTSIGLKKVGVLKSEVAQIKNVPPKFNIGYLNTYKTKKTTKIAVVPVGYKDGYNIGTKEDMFRTVDKLRNLKHQIHNLFTKQCLKVLIKDRYYNVIGKVGMYHITVNISESNIKLGDDVEIAVNPLYVNETVRREYV